MRARSLFCLFAFLVAPLHLSQADVDYAPVLPGHRITFPADEGSHPQFRGEWWYLTGWLENAQGKSFGFQVTFFRHRPGHDEDNPSRFAAKQMLFAHVSLSDPAQGRLLRDEKARRAGFDLAEAQEGSMNVFIDEWSLRRRGDQITTTIGTDEFRFDLVFDADQPPLLQGRAGFSQKGPASTSASHYYSLPQLKANGVVEVNGQRHTVRGTAWLDHEWFSSIMDERATGWDWVGLNLHDGSSIMALQMRDLQGREYWAAGTRRDAEGRSQTFERDQIRFAPVRLWRSARTGARYPVESRITIGDRVLTVRPLMDDQENDARGSTGTLYWEGAVGVFDEQEKEIGRGYLELTGYGGRIRF
jgi:predicted secreted hydrolase